MEKDRKRDHDHESYDPKKQNHHPESVINPDGTYNEDYKPSHLTDNQNPFTNTNLIPNPDDFDEGDNDGAEDSERDATRTPGL